MEIQSGLSSLQGIKEAMQTNSKSSAWHRTSPQLATMHSYLFVLEKLHLIVIEASNGIYINPTNCALSQPYWRTPDTNLPEQNRGEI